MNNDLISRSELTKAFEETVCIEPMHYAFVKQIIDNAPTVEQKEFEQVLQPIKVNIPEDIKDELIEELSKPRKVILDESKTVTDCIIAYGDGFESARRLFERPHGEWIEFKYGLYFCSNCFDKVDKDIERIEHLVAKRDLSPFCPSCGSLMKGGGESD